MKKLKIGIFVDNYFPAVDGVIMVVDNYAKRLDKLGEVVVVAPSYGTKNKNYQFPYRIIRVKSIPVPIVNYNLATPAIDLNLKKRLMDEKFDIIHIHSPFTIGKLGVEIARKMNIPVVGTMHSQFKRDFLRYTKNEWLATKLTNKLVKVFDDCDETWGLNKAMIDLYRDYGHVGKPIIMPNATDMEPVNDIDLSRKIVNDKYGLNDNDLVLLFVGRINIVKNILFIADVLKILKKKKIDFKMLFVGGGNDLDLLKEKIERYKLSSSVIFCGEVKDRELLRNIFSRSKLFVFPSLYDASSIVQIEAASQKIPTIFLEGAITASTIKPDVNGFIGPNNATKFANKIIKILNEPKLYDKVSERAFKDIYKNYDKMTKRIYRRYLYIIKKRK